MVWRCVLFVVLVGLLSACATDPAAQLRSAHRDLIKPGLVRGDGAAALERRMALRKAYDERLQALVEEQTARESRQFGQYDDVEVLTSVQITGSRIASVSITNTQEADVDEGGLIKLALGHLIVLRDGWPHSVALGAGTHGTLDLIDSVNLRTAPNSGSIWFAEVMREVRRLALPR